MWKHIKNPKKSAINYPILLKDHDTNYGKLSILLNESSVLKLHMKESLLIQKYQPELNSYVYSYFLKHDVCSFLTIYCIFIFCCYFINNELLKINKIFDSGILLWFANASREKRNVILKWNVHVINVYVI